MPIGTGDWVTATINEHLNGRADKVTFAVVSNPEFLAEGSAVQDFLTPDRVVLGSTNRAAAEKVAELYKPLKAPIIITDLRSAEMIKYASNAMLATRVSFINEMSQICEAWGADVKVVAEGMGYDKRIGPSFLKAGIGYGGSCFPKDVKALSYMAAKANCHPQLLLAVMDINTDSRRFFVQKIERTLGSIANRKFGVWGLAFKPNTDDMREAPSLDIIPALIRKGATVKAFDPIAMNVAKGLLPGSVEYCEDPYQVTEGVDALLLLTEWNEFKQVDFERVRNSMSQPYFFDGRNLYDPHEMTVKYGFTYRSVGRSNVE
jgi:UDPglucose 6-dehydrogenase